MTPLSILRNLQLLTVAAVSLNSVGCVLEDSTSQTAQQIAVALTTDHAAYQQADSVVVTYAGLSGAATDWVALAHPSDPDNTYSAWLYTGGGSDGSVTLPAANLATGTYEARAFNDWNQTQAFTVVARSATFTVGTVTTAATVTTDASSYASSVPVIVSYDGLPGTATDWIGLAPPGSAPEVYKSWKYTPGTPSGQVSLESVPPGTYVARAYASDGFVISGTSTQFTVGLVQGAVATDKAQYAINEQIVVNFSGLTTDPTDWIAIAPAGADSATYKEWHYTNGAVSGSMSFQGLVAGSYEARAFLSNGFVQAGSTTFSVVGATGTSTNATEYNVGDSVTVSYANLPGNDRDWVAVSMAGSSADSYVQWAYTHGQKTGSYTFTGLAAGSYEARSYVNDTSTILSQSTFRVFGPIETLAPTYTTAGTVDVRYSGLGGNPTDWISVALVGSDDTAYVQWVRAGSTTGHVTFTGLAAGSYEARSYLNDSYTVEHRTTFTVTN